MTTHVARLDALRMAASSPSVTPVLDSADARDRVIGVDHVDERRLRPALDGGDGTTTAPRRVSTSRRALTNWCGKSALVRVVEDAP